MVARQLPMLLGAWSVPDLDSAECTEFKQRAVRELEASPEIELVVLAGRWQDAFYTTPMETGGSYEDFLVDAQSSERSADATIRVFQRSLARAVDVITGLGKQVVIMGPIPEPGFDVPQLLSLAAYNGRPEFASLKFQDVMRFNSPIDAVMREIAEGREDVTYMPLFEEFCGEACPLIRDGIPLYSDDDHLTATGAAGVLKLIVQDKLVWLLR